jgi:hypothetical protein
LYHGVQITLSELSEVISVKVVAGVNDLMMISATTQASVEHLGVFLLHAMRPFVLLFL